MDLGSELRTARERAGLSLSEIAARTRIPERSLRAIEENDFASVPRGIFVRSFIRTYAREVGVDPVEAIAEYRSMTEPVPKDDDDAHREVVEEEIPPRPFAPDLSEPRHGWGYVIIAATVLIGLAGVNRYGSQDQSAVLTTDTAIGTEAPKVASNTETGTDAPRDAALPVPTTGNVILMEMRAQGLCWVRAVVDGQEAFARLMQPGEMETLSGQRDITVRVGDPAALTYSINGRSGQPLGAANEPVTVRFDASGRATLVS